MSKTSVDFPEPDRPVTTTISSRGISTETFCRLCSLAPTTEMAWLGVRYWVLDVRDLSTFCFLPFAFCLLPFAFPCLLLYSALGTRNSVRKRDIARYATLSLAPLPQARLRKW